MLLIFNICLFAFGDPGHSSPKKAGVVRRHRGIAFLTKPFSVKALRYDGRQRDFRSALTYPGQFAPLIT
jgi:hypothetical protein